MKSKKANFLNLDTLTPAERKKVERVLSPRDTVLALRFAHTTIDLWKKTAAHEKVSMTEWVERTLNAAIHS